MKHVLILEDNMALAFDWQDAFELNGYQVTLCFNGDEAISLLESTRFDLVITDIFIESGKGGLHVITKLLTMREQAPPAIAVTGATSGAYPTRKNNLFLEQAIGLGVDATIEKPFPAAELILTAHLLLD